MEKWRSHGRALRARLLLEDEENGGTSFVLNSDSSIDMYYKVAEKIHDQFAEAYESQQELKDTYVLGHRLIHFLSRGLPTHVQYLSDEPAIAELRSKGHERLVRLIQELEYVALLIDQEELSHHLMGSLTLDLESKTSSDEEDRMMLLRSKVSHTIKAKDKAPVSPNRASPMDVLLGSYEPQYKLTPLKSILGPSAKQRGESKHVAWKEEPEVSPEVSPELSHEISPENTVASCDFSGVGKDTNGWDNLEKHLDLLYNVEKVKKESAWTDFDQSVFDKYGAPWNESNETDWNEPINETKEVSDSNQSSWNASINYDDSWWEGLDTSKPAKISKKKNEKIHHGMSGERSVLQERPRKGSVERVQEESLAPLHSPTSVIDTNAAQPTTSTTHEMESNEQIVLLSPTIAIKWRPTMAEI
mmetsp:Transcript_6449/g.11497  ORF Transcript_6449/g.11497 Transcript_6449/m.11497 type:complete len:416 (-) Transcript_6449:55-1302(-)